MADSDGSVPERQTSCGIFEREVIKFMASGDICGGQQCKQKSVNSRSKYGTLLNEREIIIVVLCRDA